MRFLCHHMSGRKGHIGHKTVAKHLENTVNTHSKLERAHAESSTKADKVFLISTFLTLLSC